ncbi:kinase-like domain-containing protein [Irpex rosettiformis]|uniref:Kinase-like domain-containing protein n=1 Tax=Irpex rosettiformis TaxID=378272 RepID=A0ACB8UDF4_9APHY|nr:kinase-like domain-containing protein [Irpex rosettiformis]
MDVFYAPPHAFTRQPLNYHLYTHPRPDSMQFRYFMSDTLREDLQKRSEAVHAPPPPGLVLPEETQGYHSLVPLELVIGERRKFGNWFSTVYKAVNSNDGICYALRRIEGYRLNNQSAFSNIEAWSRIRHPNLVSVKEAFTTRAFNDNSLVVVYDYHPNSQTLFEAHLRPKAPQYQNGRLQSQNTRIPERTLWSYVVQIASAMKTVHDVGLAMRIVDATKVLVTGPNRVRVSSCGIVDILTYEARQDMSLLQQEDLTMFGRLIFTLCCNNPSAVNNMAKSMETLSRHYSQELRNVILYLMAKPNPMKNIRQVCEMIAPQTLTEFDETQSANDRLEGELMSELENGHLVRLLCKFGFINERPEFARDPRWSETGDRYIIKLFRDYVFHQVDEHGNPVVNLGHVLTCLNKLDAGVDERIMLVSRDEQSCLVVSYREIKSCIETAFGELSTSLGTLR